MRSRWYRHPVRPEVPKGGAGQFRSASSSDGTKLAVTAFHSVYYPGSSYIHTSEDSGATWTAQTSAGDRTWYGMASSWDGTKLAVGVWDGSIYTGEAPTRIKLSSFQATPTASRVRLQWQTEFEIDTVGFHLWRTGTENGDYSRITGSLIPSEGNVSSGASYSYRDSGVDRGHRYFYRLEDIDQNGTGAFHGPVSATVGIIRLVAPGDKTEAPFGSPTRFRWKSVSYSKFRLQISNRADCKSGVVTLPTNGTWISALSYAPSKANWKTVAGVAGNKGTVYWRVLGKAPSGSRYLTEAFQLAIEK